jgi:hypothetical protein
MTLHENVMAALVYTVPALGKIKDGVPEFKDKKSELIVDAQAKLLIDKSDFITTRQYPATKNRVLIIRFEGTILRGSARNKLWDIYVEFDVNTTRYPRLKFHTLRPEFAHLKDSNPDKWYTRNFISAIHPHVSSSGACFGQFESPVMGLLAAFNYTGAMMVVKNFLNTWNRDSAYFDINYIRRNAHKPRLENPTKQPHKLLDWAELAYLKRRIYDAMSGRGRFGISFWETVDFAINTKTKKGINWRMVESWSYVSGWMNDKSKSFFVDYKEMKHCNRFLSAGSIVSFQFHNEVVNSFERDIALWLNDKFTGFQGEFRNSAIKEMPQYMIKEWWLWEKAQEEHISTDTIEMHNEAESRWKKAVKEYLTKKIESMKRAYMKKAVEHSKVVKKDKYGYSDRTRRLETMDNVLNMFNPEYYEYIINQIKLACCVKAWKKAQTKERKLKNEIATLRREPQQAELFHEAISE